MEKCILFFILWQHSLTLLHVSNAPITHINVFTIDCFAIQIFIIYHLFSKNKKKNAMSSTFTKHTQVPVSSHTYTYTFKRTHSAILYDVFDTFFANSFFIISSILISCPIHNESYSWYKLALRRTTHFWNFMWDLWVCVVYLFCNYSYRFYDKRGKNRYGEREKKTCWNCEVVFVPTSFPVCLRSNIHLNMENRFVNIQRRLFAATRECTFSLGSRRKLQQNSMTPQTCMVLTIFRIQRENTNLIHSLSTFKV